MKIQDLYEKIREFESAQSAQAQSLSNCKKGCSRCCYVDLSVFTIEAKNIKAWFESLTEKEQLSLQEKWQKPSRQTTDFHGQWVSSCPFLFEESCTIYEARPLICRTQGMALLYQAGEEKLLDICPLNNEMLEKIESHDMLNLDLLNHILSEFERLDAQGEVRPRQSLLSLRTALLER